MIIGTAFQKTLRGALARISHAGGTTSAPSASMPATFRFVLSSLRFQPRPPQCQQLSGLLSPLLGFSPAAAEPTHLGLDRQIGEYRISSIPLSASARAKALYGALIQRGRDDLRVVRLNALTLISSVSAAPVSTEQLQPQHRQFH